ncbi:hypothetical protein O181_101549 [Austropuccinia psidii MF-1]|uniref:Uncharacterized protein n=1 Tax=Austropuccinia psidii MF-1 TaxID=1389203 RepID=A0A9Q3JHE2_9BASI|nr:hypothetical protein [Austropuccinia psidii MF-1]
MRPLGPFWPKSNETKRGKFISPSEPVLSPNPNQPKMAKTTSGPELTKDHLWATIQSMVSGNHQRPPAQLQGKMFPFSMHPVLKDTGVVHIWYNIPLWTIFVQQSYGEIFRTKSSTQSITIFEGGSFSYFSLEIPWWLPEDHSRTSTTWPCRVWVVISHQDYSKSNSQRLSIIVKASSTQHFLDTSIGPYRS